MKFFKRKKEAGAQPVPHESAPEIATAAPGPVPDDLTPADETTAAVPARSPDADKEGARPGFFSRLRRGLGRTSENLLQGMGTLFLGRKEIDEGLLEQLESRLLLADVGVDATRDIIAHLTQRVSRKELTHADGLQAALREELLGVLRPCEQALDVAGKKPFVILMVGVNGVGKTTTIGKLARRYMAEGRSVMLAAGDTFRAAAVEQLQV